ncbi:hypothetical protein B1757_12950 [Acidithiobacillus marinus]|uniref:Uncharacterized protein n=1 Tax=Acidithiobacillus marinus TaxID=187490 RepID=A0A2I1DIZ6_9PROT|nr:hypothetical protein [Acidithiobacillus marinus]PKY09850.1 hypothetical protein B1757_12950 [Acidithiobacillus marinus]
MPNMQVKIEFLLDSPIIITKPLHLDALLLAIADERAGGGFIPGMAHYPIPVVIDGGSGIYRCSQLLWEGTQFEDRIIQHQKTLFRTNNQDVFQENDIIQSIPRKKRSELEGKHPFKPKMDAITARWIPQVFFLAETDDLPALTDMAHEIPALGKWSRKGYGTVRETRISVLAEDTDPWIHPDGQRPARALPVDLWATRYGHMEQQQRLGHRNTRPPYFLSGEREICVIP